MIIKKMIYVPEGHRRTDELSNSALCILFSVKVEDRNCIDQIIKSAFKQMTYSNHKEHVLVSVLRNNDALTLFLVAESNDNILGHIAFSEVTINGEFAYWYGLAPVSVDPKYQDQGIGSKLIESGLDKFKDILRTICRANK